MGLMLGTPAGLMPGNPALQQFVPTQSQPTVRHMQANLNPFLQPQAMQPQSLRTVFPLYGGFHSGYGSMLPGGGTMLPSFGQQNFGTPAQGNPAFPMGASPFVQQSTQGLPLHSYQASFQFNQPGGYLAAQVPAYQQPAPPVNPGTTQVPGQAPPEEQADGGNLDDLLNFGPN